MLDTRIARQWDDDIVPQLIDYIRLPAKSPHFDPEWKRHGHVAAAIAQARKWAEGQDIQGLELEMVAQPVKAAATTNTNASAWLRRIP